MKKYTVTFLFSLLVVLVFVARVKATKKAVAARTKTVNSLGVVVPSSISLPTIGIGIGPTPCPPDCSHFAK